MKTTRNILIAFILNLSFSVFELFGGIFTGSVAVISDAIHDAGDAVSIGISYFLERKSQKQPDEKYTYGYGGYSVLGGLFTTVILLIGAVFMIYNAVCKIITPAKINYNGMIVFAVIGVCVNFCAAFFTRGGSVNQKAVNLHMLEDVLGWAVVLVGAIIMRFTDIAIIDPILSLGVSVFIIINAIKNLKDILRLLLAKTPENINISEIKAHLEALDGVLDIHHIHVWSLDSQNIFATMHIVTDSEQHEIKAAVRRELFSHGIGHVTIETETSAEHCCEKCCHIEHHSPNSHHHHHHKH